MHGLLLCWYDSFKILIQRILTIVSRLKFFSFNWNQVCWRLPSLAWNQKNSKKHWNKNFKEFNRISLSGIRKIFFEIRLFSTRWKGLLAIRDSCGLNWVTQSRVSYLFIYILKPFFQQSNSYVGLANLFVLRKRRDRRKIWTFVSVLTYLVT